jgi:hypothetical protein
MIASQQRFGLSLALCSVAGAACLQGQSVLTPAPQYEAEVPRAAKGGPAGESSSSGPARAPSSYPLSWAGMEAHPHLLYRFIYGDGIQSRPGQKSKTVINEIAPGLLLNLGTQWRVDYTPTLRYYSSKDFKDTLTHSAFFSGGTMYKDWTFGVSQAYSSTEDPLVETGQQTSSENYATALSAHWIMNSRLSLELGASQNFRFVDQAQALNLTDSKDWSTMDWLNYQLTPDLMVGLGGGGGYADVAFGSDMTFEQAMAHSQWKPLEKVSLEVHGGAEFRQFRQNGANDLVNPMYGGSIDYRPFEVTTLSLKADRSVRTSYFQGQVTETTDVNATLSQRLLEKLTLTIAGGYRWSDFVASTRGVAVNRSDEGAYVNSRLSLKVLEKGSVAVFYSHQENTSNTRNFQYSSDQYGVELGYRF